MRLTKQKAIKEHRKMWNQIADWYEADFEEIKKNYDVVNVKRAYMRKNHFHGVINNCFCCEYGLREMNRKHKYSGDNDVDRCANCPLCWDSKSKSLMCAMRNGEWEEYAEGYYQEAIDLSAHLRRFPTSSECRSKLVSMCRKIANLPENMEV